jgi:hypothetical protein
VRNAPFPVPWCPGTLSLAYVSHLATQPNPPTHPRTRPPLTHTHPHAHMPSRLTGVRSDHVFRSAHRLINLTNSLLRIIRTAVTA